MYICNKFNKKMNKLGLKFIEKANRVHKNTFDYTKVEYKGSTISVEIICPKHGSFFQTPQTHLRGSGCPLCANTKRGKKRLTNEELKDRLKKIHGDEYLYDKVEYLGETQKITLICPIHGEFKINTFSALNGSGCPKCAGKGLTNEEIIEKIKLVHGNKYDYSKVEYKKSSEKICLICPIHGEFFVTPSKIFNRGDGCPKCSKENARKKNILNSKDVLENFSRVHGDVYDYSIVEYINMHTKVKIICKKHGIFEQLPYDHIHGHGCPMCSKLESKCEKEIIEKIKENVGDIEIIENDRKVLEGREIDILFPFLNIGIEYNDLRWHSNEFCKDKYYHKNKMLLANSKGIKLIQIFEDEYLNNKNLVINKILHIIGYNNKPKIYARKCDIRYITKEQSMTFLNNNHIQGYGKCSFSYGCFYNNKLCGVMSFLKNRSNDYELIRFATDNKYQCIGVGGKLFKHFVSENKPNMVKTFADLRWTVDSETNLYSRLGFKKDKILEPDYKYVSINNPSKRMHKFNFRKKIISERYNIPNNLTESEMAKIIGVSKIYDCGLIRYIWKKDA